tara:strand:- start:475 stop:627 length:153 start_codon:yes stop_codon:yes gene_type:complete
MTIFVGAWGSYKLLAAMAAYYVDVIEEARPATGKKAQEWQALVSGRDKHE